MILESKEPLLVVRVGGLPIAQPRQRHTGFIAGGRIRVHNYTPKTHPVQSFKALLALAARQAWAKPPLEGPLRVEVTFRFPLPTSARSATKKLVAAGEWVPHTTKPDSDNLWKSTIDSLTAILWLDDKQISEGVWRKGYGVTPGVEVLVWAL